MYNYKYTIFFDIDGTLLDYPDDVDFTDIVSGAYQQKVLPGVLQYITDLHKVGHIIILTTGRPECMRDATVSVLAKLGIVYNQLIMDVGAGPRILVNDNYKNQVKAYAIDIPRNGNFIPKMKEIINE